MNESVHEGAQRSLRVFTNHTDWVVARGLGDAQRVVEAHYGATFEQEGWSLDELGRGARRRTDHDPQCE